MNRALNSPRDELSDLSTTLIYTHVTNRGPSGTRSPADGLFED